MGTAGSLAGEKASTLLLYADRAFLRCFLLGGPDSSRLEFNSEYFARILDSPYTSSAIFDHMRANPEPRHARAVTMARIAAALNFRHTLPEANKPVTEAYKQVGELVLSGRNAVELPCTVGVSDLDIPISPLLQSTESTELARVTLQFLNVHDAVAVTGEIPQI